MEYCFKKGDGNKQKNPTLEVAKLSYNPCKKNIGKRL